MQTKILDTSSPQALEDSADEAAMLLRSGELVAFPTETVYGLGANALDPEAIARVFAAKGRPGDNPLIVHVATTAELARCGRLDERALALAAAFMPGPLTLVIPSHSEIPTIARAGLPTVAVRIPDHPVALALLARSGPLVAPSANRSGRPSPTTARHVIDDLGGRIAAVLDGGACRVGIESTVVDTSGENVVILRPGVISAAEIEAVLGEPATIGADANESVRSPGMKYRHYAPATPVRLVIDATPPSRATLSAHVVILTTPKHMARFAGADVRLLSESTLYALLRDADTAGAGEIVIYAEPGELAAGLLDRVRRAGGELGSKK